MQRKKHWTFNKIVHSEKARAALIYIAEKKQVKLSDWNLHSKFQYRYLQFFVLDCLHLGLIKKEVKWGWYSALPELYHFLRYSNILYNGGIDGHKQT